MRDVADPAQLLIEAMPGVRLQRRREQRPPAIDLLAVALRRAHAIHRAQRRSVALEVRRIDLELIDRTRGSELDDRPLVAGTATPPRLPAVGHAARRARLDQIEPRAEEHVA